MHCFYGPLDLVWFI